MQAIVTKYFGATNHKGGRIKAKCAAGSITVGYNHELDPSGNHRAAAMALVRKLGWTEDKGYTGTWYRGGHPDGTGDVFVCTSKFPEDSFKL